MPYFFHRFGYAFGLLVPRLRRIGYALLRVCPWRLQWWQDVAFWLLDLLFVFDLYEMLSNSLALRTRTLLPEEVALLQGIFGQSIPYSLIRIDEYARLGPLQYHLCYVSFYTINSWGPMPPDILVHEAVHIWQYQQVGAAYIPRALAAQRTPEAYNYGGISPLQRFPSLQYFNCEQQADIIADAYRYQTGKPLRWIPQQPIPRGLFEPFLGELREGGSGNRPLIPLKIGFSKTLPPT